MPVINFFNEIYIIYFKEIFKEILFKNLKIKNFKKFKNFLLLSLE